MGTSPACLCQQKFMACINGVCLMLHSMLLALHRHCSALCADINIARYHLLQLASFPWIWPSRCCNCSPTPMCWWFPQKTSHRTGTNTLPRTQCVCQQHECVCVCASSMSMCVLLPIKGLCWESCRVLQDLDVFCCCCCCFCVYAPALCQQSSTCRESQWNHKLG